ncbi:MAG: TDG/mug DNA glycosylase family protein [Pseudohongiellaceae bacterium]|jgi:hypoxanthine-DNA glycosylase
MHKIDQGLLPILGEAPAVLILGSMPSVKSLESQQYYAHPQNAFWWIMSELFSFDPLEPYEVKVNHLKQKRVAVWDVIKACHRPGSLDSAIDSTSIQANDFSMLLSGKTSIKLVIFNGQAAQKIFNKHALSVGKKKHETVSCRINNYAGDFLLMPSTSPANAATKRDMKLNQWRALNVYL